MNASATPFLGQTRAKRIVFEPIPLHAFRSIETDKLSWALGVASMFALSLMRRSRVRPMKAGHANLMIEAAEDVIRFYLPALRTIYRQCDLLLHPSKSTIIHLAGELCSELSGGDELKRETNALFELMRDTLLSDHELTNSNRVLMHYRQSEQPVETFIHWLDYVEYLKEYDRYEGFYGVHRLLVCCVRVNHAVFGCSY